MLIADFEQFEVLLPSSIRRGSFNAGTALHSEHVFRILIDSVRDYAIFLLTPEGDICSWNPGAERIKGYKPHEIIGKNFRLFYPPEDLATDKPGHELKVAGSGPMFSLPESSTRVET
ncbi:MAG: hypothetical protein DMG61_22805 [Acidobacteria bacterium]|nr:MAG: hypothetical protein DMG61_22805 [Acidobacteriota bacterium]